MLLFSAGSSFFFLVTLFAIMLPLSGIFRGRKNDEHTTDDCASILLCPKQPAPLDWVTTGFVFLVILPIELQTKH